MTKGNKANNLKAMKRTTYSLSWYCRQSKASKKTGLAPIELSLVINGTRVFINLPRKEYPNEFKKAISAKRTNPIKEYLEEVRNQFNNIQTDMLKNGITLTADTLKEYYHNGGIKTYTIKDLFDEYYKLLEKRVDVNLSYSAYRKYKDARNCFYKYVDPEKELTSITPSTIENFKAEIDKSYKPSSVNGIMTKIKTVFMYGKDNGKININPFSTVKYSKIDNGIEYLDEEEIGRLKSKPIENDRLAKVRDIAVFMLSSGLSYADTAQLEKDDIKFTDDGTCYIYKKRQKTGTEFTSVVLSDGVDVLRKYNLILPVITNQKMNNYLKELQTLCDIHKTLHCHLFRKTYGTLLLNKGVRLETVSKCLGHKNTKITQQAYTKLLSQTVIDEVKAVI